MTAVLRTDVGVFAIRGGHEILVGRTGNDIGLRLDHRTMSRRQCRLTFVPPLGWRIEDLMSTAGTYVDEERIRERHLADGDHLRLAGVTAMFEEDGRPPDPGAPRVEPIAGDLPGRAEHRRSLEGLAALTSDPLGASTAASRLTRRLLEEGRYAAVRASLRVTEESLRAEICDAAITHALDSRDPAVRQCAVFVLETLELPAARRTLDTLTRDAEPWMRALAARHASR